MIKKILGTVFIMGINQLYTKADAFEENPFKASAYFTTDSLLDLTEYLEEHKGKNLAGDLFEMTGESVSFSSRGAYTVLSYLSKISAGIKSLFELNKEDIQRSLEKNDPDLMDSLRAQIRSEVAKSNNGKLINQLLADEDLDFFIQLKLTEK